MKALCTLIIILVLFTSCGVEDEISKTDEGKNITTQTNPNSEQGKTTSNDNKYREIRAFLYIPNEFTESHEREITLEESGFYEFSEVKTVNETEIKDSYYRFEVKNEPSRCTGYYEYVVVSYDGKNETITNGEGVNTGESYRVPLPFDERVQPTSTLKLYFKHACETGEVKKAVISMKLMIEGGI